MRVFYSQGPELVFYEGDADSAVDRMRIEEGEDGSVTWAHDIRDDGVWRPVWQARVEAAP